MFPDRTTLAIFKLCVAGALLLGIWLWGHHSGSAGLADEKAAHQATKQHYADVLEGLRAKTQRAATLAEQASKALASSQKANDERFEHAKRQAQHDQADLRRRLRNGTVRLQPWWTPDLSGRAIGQGAADAGQADAAIRFDSASRIIGAGDRDAAMMGWLYESWKAEHDAGLKAGCFVEVTP